WRRPTWPLGTRTGNDGEKFADPLRLLGRDGRDGTGTRAADVQLQSLTPSEREAISVLGLVAPVTKADVKVRYKILAKMLHPDANGGDKRAEDRLKSVNYAYTTLQDSERLI
ncbi:MAG TPA: molecular chaperone DnaJ, partial [Rhodospirillaceae bacterium]|nr:molecular chaperone DnaJ [Rhodospirillaceae bacterium]